MAASIVDDFVAEGRVSFTLKEVGALKNSSFITEKAPSCVPLVPAQTTRGSKFSRRWRLFVNAVVEADV